ncbi:anti-phage deoxyguanosine triphosphatase [Belnapia rosea]|uniref:Deoxyguanosinetriphosphate triphosphohydrolase-like protein n=1 Tax=Belnapia rosea TaxID=938405 RepID=A0A1G6ZGU8_9PROT|nr:anti-phage deoxyguanosine triphosphatase [Belnapia rosea]SDB33592.1 dGTPase [Belnapia rosea]SDE01682.1 dGTPase [Belnapia rosea]
MCFDDPSSLKYFEVRRIKNDGNRHNDVRSPFQRDRARIVHSSAFRRLQGKTQVMGVGEGDYHRTRLTHSIECAQIGQGILDVLVRKKMELMGEDFVWLPDRDLVEAACFAHDLGHPPFGHGGERALHAQMVAAGGFEGNGQTLRIISKLEKYGERNSGINPTRRLILSILKYPIIYNDFPLDNVHPPKCYFNEEKDVVDWALAGFDKEEVKRFVEKDEQGKAKHKTLDCSIMDCADDIAYGIHDIEDIIARNLVQRNEISQALYNAFKEVNYSLEVGAEKITADSIESGLYKDSYSRKQTISKLVNIMITSARIEPVKGFQHPLLKYKVKLGDCETKLLKKLKKISFELVVEKAKVQQLERRGQKIVQDVYCTLLSDPEKLIPSSSWANGEIDCSVSRRVCDYVAGMTDGYAEKVYRRLFLPGFGSSSDEL